MKRKLHQSSFIQYSQTKCIHFYDGNGRTSKILFVNDDEINVFMRQ